MEHFNTQRWINGSGTLGGHAALVRKNVSLANVPRHSHPHTVLVSLRYESRTANGWPSDRNELVRLDNTEEAIVEKFWTEHRALFGLSVTTDGTRDLFMFLPQSIDDDGADALIQSANPTVDYDFRIIEDPAWEPYDLL